VVVVDRWLLQGCLCALRSFVVAVAATVVLVELECCWCRPGRLGLVGQCSLGLQH